MSASEVPPELPKFIGKFTKEIVQYQPDDIIDFSIKYFTALVKGECFSMDRKALALTPEILASLHEQLSDRGKINRSDLAVFWKLVNIEEDTLNHILSLGQFEDQIEWDKFLASCCSYLGQTIKEALTTACYTMNSDPDCKPPDACVPFGTFQMLYKFLAKKNGNVLKEQIDGVLTYLRGKA
ncbi:ropporin-1-like [Hypomesus transpacificus]|uniref:ropporin-1-like n=1 Tax=Hypomesus transpacificus TaxID=137520 RepID=UPI001F07C06F|nr:ropporin-1-like [Hypomesus transpacificus]